MANPEHLKILKQGVEVWNKWREENPEIKPDLSEANLTMHHLPGVDFTLTNLCNAILYVTNLSKANLSFAILIGANLSYSKCAEANFFGAILSGANMSRIELTGANMSWAKLDKATLVKASMSGANLFRADLSEANLTSSNLAGASLSQAILYEANLTEASLHEANLVKTNFTNAILERTWIYGISVWDIKKDGLVQKDLIITPPGEPEVTVDDLDVAQFIYLMLNNEKIRDVIETITSKAVLILGRFTPERKAVLDAIKDELRLRNYLPIVFDFENAANKSVDEIVNLLARMSRFVIADITDAKSIPQELRGFVPDNPSIPIVPLIWKAQHEYAMFDYFRNFPWVLPLHEYESPEQLMKNIIAAIIMPAEQKVQELKNK